MDTFYMPRLRSHQKGLKRCREKGILLFPASHTKSNIENLQRWTLPKEFRYSSISEYRTNVAIALIKKENQYFSPYIRKFRVEQLQSHIWGKASQYMRKWGNISPYIRRPFVIYDFATAPFWISLYMGKFLFSFLSVHGLATFDFYYSLPTVPGEGFYLQYVKYTRGNVRYTNRRQLDYLCNLDNVNYRKYLGKLHGKGHICLLYSKVCTVGVSLVLSLLNSVTRFDLLLYLQMKNSSTCTILFDKKPDKHMCSSQLYFSTCSIYFLLIYNRVRFSLMKEKFWHKILTIRNICTEPRIFLCTETLAILIAE